MQRISIFIVMSISFFAIIAPNSQAKSLMEKISLKGTGTTEFTAYYQKGEKEPKGGVLILSPLGKSANEPNLLAPLRRLLVRHHWTVLSISLSATKFDDKAIITRIQAGLDYLKEQKVEPLYFISYENSAASAIAFMKKNPKAVRGLSSISALIRGEKQQLKTQLKEFLSKDIYWLDIVGDFDYMNITHQAALRNTWLMDNAQYQQYIIRGADHYYSQLQTLLAKKIRAWMQQDRG